MLKIQKIQQIAKIVPGIINSYIFKRPCTVSFDVTWSCSLDCSYCYYKQTKPKRQLNEDEMLNKIRSVSESFPIYHASFVGGEPTLRPRLLERSMNLFPHKWILTNGVRGFPENIEPSAWVVSLDGTEDIHDGYKGKGIHRRVIDNINDSSAVIFSNTTIQNQNHHCLEELVEEMKDTNLKYMTFSFYTPVGTNGSDGEDEFLLSDESKVSIISRIVQLRKKYPDFIFYSPLMEYYYHPGRGYKSWNEQKRCPVAIIGRHYGADGEIQLPCAMGPDADCSHCGCGMNTIFLALIHGDVKAMKMLMELI